MENNFLFALLTTVICSGCSKGLPQKPLLLVVDNEVLLSQLQTYFREFQTCAILPTGIGPMIPNRVTKISVQRMKKRFADPKLSPQPFIDAGLIQIVTPQYKYADRFVHFEYTELGLSKVSNNCTRDGMHGITVKTRGFPVFDIQVERILSSRTPYKVSCVWFTSAKYDIGLRNIAHWYDPDKFKLHLNRELAPSKDGGHLTKEARLFGMGGSWSLKNFDFAHSNLVCPDTRQN